MTFRESDVRCPDGRSLRVREDGDANGLPIFSLHGTPGCRFLYPRHVEDARRRGLRLIGYDRPGYGGSTPQRDRRVVDAAYDVRAIADALGVERFAVWGHSGGGHHALACAAVLPPRVVAVAALASDAPYTEVTAEGGDWFRGMSDWHAQYYRWVLEDPSKLDALSPPEEPTREQFRERLSSILSDVDRAALTDEMVDFAIASDVEAQRDGMAGARDDTLAQLRPWGFDLRSVHAPLQLWQGQQDRFVPFAFGQWLAAHLPEAEAHLEPNEGHLTMFEHRIPEVHEWLAARF